MPSNHFLIPNLMAVLFTALTASLHADNAKAPSPVPQIQYDLGSAYPSWVAAEIAFTEHGELDPALFAPSVFSRLSRAFRETPRRESGCVPLPEWIIEHPAGAYRENLEQALGSADHVVVVRVTARSYGFMKIMAGTLLHVQRQEVLKGSAHALRSQGFIRFPGGTFSAGPHAICSPNSQYTSTPEIGERLLLLLGPGEPAADTNGVFATGGPTGIIRLSARGEVDLPSHYENDSNRRTDRETNELFLHRVRDILEGREQ